MNTYISKFLIAVAIFVGASTLSQSAFAAGANIFTMPATSISPTSITFNGIFSNNLNNPLNVHFNWGTTSALNTYTPYQTFSTSVGSYSETITGLTPGTTYYFRAEGFNTGGTSISTVTVTTATLSAPVTPPTVETIAGNYNLTSSSASISGFFNGNGAATSTQFEYATNSALTGSSMTPSVTQSQSGGTFSDTITGLTPNTTYYYRAKATNSAGTSTAQFILHFTTNPIITSSCSISTPLTASPSSISSGQTSHLTWASTGCVSASISSVGSVALSSTGQGAAVAPTSTTTYILTVTDSNGATHQSSTTVSVSSLNTCSYTFNVNPNPVTTGGTVTVSWTSLNCTTVNVTGGGISSNLFSSNGITSSPLSGTTTFTLTPTGAGAVAQSITVTTQSSGNGGFNGGYYYGNGYNQNCTINSFTSNINPVVSGGNSSLIWSTYNCSYVRITGPGINNSYSPNSTVTTPELSSSAYYTLTAYDSYGASVFATTVVNVIGQANTNSGTCAINNFAATPSQIAVGQSTTLSWTTTGCNFVKITSNTPNVLNLQNYTADGTYTVSPNGSGTYFITAYGQNTSVTSQAYVTVGSTYVPTTTFSNNDGYSGPNTNTNVVTRPTTTPTTLGSNALMSGSTVSYGNPNSYVGSNLAGLSLAGSNGLFPTSLLGWLLIILVIMGIVILTRKIYSNENHSRQAGNHSSGH